MNTKKVIIVGASSGIGKELARIYIQNGYTVGVAARRVELLNELKQLNPTQVCTQAIDIDDTNAPEQLLQLINSIGGMDIYVHVSGIGSKNVALNPQVELNILRTNGSGFTQMLVAAFNFFAAQGYGHIAAVTSIAGTKGLGASPAYSATKRFQQTYMQCLAQLASIRKTNITFTEIKPGFVATALLKYNYPMLMQVPPVAQSAYKAICNKKRSKIIDWRYTIIVAIWRLVPNCIWEKLNVK